jgi:hypothetical protein
VYLSLQGIITSKKKKNIHWNANGTGDGRRIVFGKLQ